MRSSSEAEHQCLIFYVKKTKTILNALFLWHFSKDFTFMLVLLSIHFHICVCFFILIKFCKVRRESISLISLKVKKISFREAVVIKATKTITQLKLKFSLSNNLPQLTYSLVGEAEK